MEGRLQFLHRNKVFATSEDAKIYIDSLVRHGLISLLAEPMVLLYGDKDKPNVLLAIGTKTNAETPGTFDFYNGNRYFFIDSAQLEADILTNKQAIKEANLTAQELENLVNGIRERVDELQVELDNTQKGAGLAEDGSYVPNVSLYDRPVIYIKDAESLNDADVKLDAALQILDTEVVKSIVVNDVRSEVEDNIASVVIDTSDINVEPDFKSVVPDLKEDGHLHIHSGDTISMVFAKIEKTYDIEKAKREETDKKLNAEIERSIEKDEIFENGLADEIVRATETEAGLRKDVDDANEKIDTFLLAADLTQDAIDTLREIQSYIDEHGEEAAKMVDDIAKNAKAIADEIDRSTKKDAELDKKDTELEKAIETEFERATDAELALKNDFDKVTSKIESEYKASDASIIAAYEKADIALNTRIDNLDHSLSDEISRATGAEEQLSKQINDEKERAENKEGELSQSIVAEKERAQAAENALDEKIDTETERATFAEEELRNDLNVEIDRAQAAEDALDEKIGTETERSQAAEDTLDEKIDTEIKRAQAAENALDEKIVAEIERATAAEGELRNGLNAEIERAQAAENALDEKIVAEINRVQAAEDALDTEIDRATSVEEELRNDLNAEIERSQAAENALDEKIVTEKERAEKKEGELAQSIVSEKERADEVEKGLRSDVNRINDNVISLQERMNTCESDISDLETRMSSAETKIEANKDNLTAEVNARISADTELQSRIDTLFANKVEIEDGKGLSTNDFSDILLNKVNSIEENAQVNKIEKIFVDDVLLDITDNKGVKINMPKVPVRGVYVDDNILSLNGTELSANISIDYNKTTKQIILYGKDTTKVISTIDVSDFIKDAMIERVEVVTLDSGKTVIRITWNTDSGKEITDVPADSLIQVYEAGEGIIKVNDTFSIKLNTNASENFLRVDGNGIYTEGIKQFVAEAIVASENVTNGQIVNLSNAVADTQSNLSELSSTVEGLKGTCNDINTDLAVANNDIDTLKSAVDALKVKDEEIENLAKNSFIPVDGEGISLSLTPGSESNRTNILTGKVKGYYTYASRPEAEKDSDYSLLRLTDDGYIFVTNSTSAMKHTDINDAPHVLSTFINTLKQENTGLKTEVETLTSELDSAKNKIAELENMLSGLISGENTEFMSMLRRAIINSDTFKDEDTDPTVEVVVTDGENVIVRTKEDAVYEGSVIH